MNNKYGEHGGVQAGSYCTLQLKGLTVTAFLWLMLAEISSTWKEGVQHIILDIIRDAANKLYHGLNTYTKQTAVELQNFLLLTVSQAAAHSPVVPVAQDSSASLMACSTLLI